MEAATAKATGRQGGGGYNGKEGYGGYGGGQNWGQQGQQQQQQAPDQNNQNQAIVPVNNVDQSGGGLRSTLENELTPPSQVTGGNAGYCDNWAIGNFEGYEW